MYATWGEKAWPGSSPSIRSARSGSTSTLRGPARNRSAQSRRRGCNTVARTSVKLPTGSASRTSGSLASRRRSAARVSASKRQAKAPAGDLSHGESSRGRERRVHQSRTLVVDDDGGPLSLSFQVAGEAEERGRFAGAQKPADQEEVNRHSLPRTRPAGCG